MSSQEYTVYDWACDLIEILLTHLVSLVLNDDWYLGKDKTQIQFTTNICLDLTHWTIYSPTDQPTQMFILMFYFIFQCSEKEKLESIYKNDPLTWPFVFYLSRTKDDCCRFESAKCSGWFIRTEFGSVCVDEKNDKDKDSEKYSFLFIRTPNTTKSKWIIEKKIITLHNYIYSI